MPGFFEITQGGWKVWGLIGSAILVLVGGGLTMYDNMTGGSLGVGKGDIPLKCSAEGCDWSDGVSLPAKDEWAQKEYDKWKQDHPGEYPINVDQLMMRDAFMAPGEQMTPEQMMDKMIIARWGEFQDNLPFTCPKCGQLTVFRAIQCEDCGEIFFMDYSRSDYPDTCPKCQHSKVKARREAAQKKRQEGRK